MTNPLMSLRNLLLSALRRSPWLYTLLRELYYGRVTWREKAGNQLIKLGRWKRHWVSYLTNGFYRTHQHWLWAKGDEKLRYAYPLTSASVVLDVGGFEGKWAEEINRRYGCRVYVFEPVKAFIDIIRQTAVGNAQISVLPYGLADSDTTTQISLLNDASSLFVPGYERETIALRDVHAVLAELQIDAIDLMKVNIEGGEFPLLERMVETGDIARVTDIQVQFHPFVDNANERYARLAASLKKTHRLTWRYPFVWENWRRKDAS